MATPRSEELRALAETIARRLPPSVTDVVLTGSVSRGVADEASDLELLLAVDAMPAAAECILLGGLHDVDTWEPSGAPIFWTGGWADGEFVELIWWERAFVDERVERIAAGEIVDWQRLKTAEAINNGIALRGESHGRWRSALSVYPPGLTAAIIADAAATWNEPPPRSVLRPGDALMLAFHVTEGAESILRIVFALNEEWPPGWKRLAQRVEPLATKPDRLAERLDAAVRTLDLRELRAIASDTLALAPNLPAVQRARRMLAEPL